jgi:hypothetical protein
MDLAQAIRPNGGEDFVDAEAGAGLQGQRKVSGLYLSEFQTLAGISEECDQ